jgi:hypothetical protein
MKIYQNGVLWHQGNAGVALGTIVNGFVGRDPDGNYYDGLIDDFAVWDEALAPQYIKALAGTASPLSIPEPSTILIWSLLALLGIGVGWRRRRG